MSRIMLCIKAIIANCMQLPTIIFDEIDTGVSGDIADRMGEMMKEISDKTADKQSISALKDIQFEIDSAKKLQAQNAARSLIK